MNAALDCIILMDHQGKVIEFNLAAEQTFGYRREEVRGKEMAELIIPPDLREPHRAGLKRYFATGDAPVLGKRLEIRGWRANGTEFPVELTITRLPSAEPTAPPMFAGFLRDLTERKRDERLLAAHHAVSHALVTLEDLTATSATESIPSRVLAAVGLNLGWEIGVFWKVQGDVFLSANIGEQKGQEEQVILSASSFWYHPQLSSLPASLRDAFEVTARTIQPLLEENGFNGLPGRVYQQRKALWVDNVSALNEGVNNVASVASASFPAHHYDVARAAGLNTAFAFPVTEGTQVQGVIEFFRRDTGPPDAELLRVVEAIGSEVGQFLHRQRLEEELQRAYERQTHIAQWLQDALRPTLPGKLSGLRMEAYYRPALAEASIGGDFFDVFSLAPDCHALVVADLSGKGLAAASQIATVRHMLRTLLYQSEVAGVTGLRKTEGFALGEIVTTLNKLLVTHNLLSGFATLFIGIFQASDLTLTYASCGQEPVLIRRLRTEAPEGTETIEELWPTGPVLGSFSDAVFEARTVVLGAGDVLALFTDGLTEAGLSRKALLGLPGMVQIFRESTTDPQASPEEIVGNIIGAVERAVTPAGMRDDVCLLVVRIE
jgi:PAS domain S-box-containing protein